MVHDFSLISTIAAGLSLALFFGLIAAKLHLSPIIGYLAAGVVIGPHSPGFIADIEIAEQLSEIGIILLMFGVGLHFSPKDLLAVKKIALPGALAQIVVATFLSMAVAAMWGWPPGAGFILGMALSVASTVVLLRTLEERDMLDTINGRIAIGWLIVEDIVIVLALVLIPAIADSLKTSGDNTVALGDWAAPLLFTISKIIMFFIFMILIGQRFLPWLLKTAEGTNSRELFTLAVFAVAMGVAFGTAEIFGVSFALGAFFGGMMLRGSELCNKVAEKSLPFQDAFAVLFFVAVGMLFDPAVLIDYPLHVLAIVTIVIIGKSLAAFLIVIALRYPWNTALVISVSLAQIGEFSFILANLGRRYEILSDPMHSMILAGALISIALNPVLFKFMPKMRDPSQPLSGARINAAASEKDKSES